MLLRPTWFQRSEALAADHQITGFAMLDLRAVTCVRGRRTLFSDLSCSVASGQLLRVRGANGAGKTSLLRMVCGLLPPTAGEVAWRGQAISGLAEEFGLELLYIGHAAALKDDLSAAENLQFACLLGGLSASPTQIGHALQQAGLGGRDTRRVGHAVRGHHDLATDHLRHR